MVKSFFKAVVIAAGAVIGSRLGFEIVDLIESKVRERFE